MHTPTSIDALDHDHNRTAFTCGVVELDRYLKVQASQDIRNKVAAVFVLHISGAQTILGYYTLSSTTIVPSSLPPSLIKRLPRYPSLPAVLLGRLAVDQRYAGQGWGKTLLIDALRRSLRHHSEVAAMAVVVDAKDDAARTFYEHYGFQRFKDHAYRLYLPMKTIEQMFSG